MKEVLKSKVVKFNIFMLLTTIVSFSSKVSDGFLSHFIPDQYLLILTAITFFGSWMINTVWPSGVLVGTGKNWNIGRYVLAIAIPITAMLQNPELAKHIPDNAMAFCTATLLPIFQTIVRILGGATDQQVQAAHKAKFKV